MIISYSCRQLQPGELQLHLMHCSCRSITLVGRERRGMVIACRKKNSKSSFCGFVMAHDGAAKVLIRVNMVINRKSVGEHANKVSRAVVSRSQNESGSRG